AFDGRRDRIRLGVVAAYRAFAAVSRRRLVRNPKLPGLDLLGDLGSCDWITELEGSIDNRDKSLVITPHVELIVAGFVGDADHAVRSLANHFRDVGLAESNDGSAGPQRLR